MKRTKEEYQKLWEETERFYSDKSKCAVNKREDICVYLDKKGNKCAVGRALNTNNPLYNKISKIKGDVYEFIVKAKIKNLDEVLFPRYKGYTVTFWKHLQIYHDCLAVREEKNVKAAKRNVKEYIRKLK